MGFEKNAGGSEDKKSIILALINGTLIAYAITCIAFIICALLLRYTTFSEENVTLFVIITSLISVLISGFDVAKNASERGWMWGLFAGGVYAVIYICLGAWLAGSVSFDTKTITLLVLAISGGGLGGIIGINIKSKKKKRI